MPKFDAAAEPPHHARTILVFAAPCVYLAAAFYLRGVAGPFWHWYLLDPSYFYLLDGLNMLAGRSPGHIAHPGVTVSSLGGLWLWFQSIGQDSEAFVRGVLSDPETYLHQLSTIYIVLNTVVLAVLGLVALRVFQSVVPALACQLAPFMSTIVLKHAFLPKPEAMLVAVTMALMAVLLLALRGMAGTRLALACGVVAGFGMATKVTGAPIFLIPLFMLADRRAILVYLVGAVVTAGIIFLPALSGFAEFIEWQIKVAMSAGSHAGGPQTVVDWAAYPDAVLKILKRPALKVPLVLGILTLALSIRHERRGGHVEGPARRCLLGITVAQVVHVVLVAKQPTAFYLIPSYMMSSLSLLLAMRLLWSMRPGSWRIPVSGNVLAALIITGFAVGQVNGLHRLANHFSAHAEKVQAVDNDKFAHCTRVFIYAASAPEFALFLADRVTGFHHSDTLAEIHTGQNFWIDDWLDQSKHVLRDWQGVREFSSIRDASPCLFLRGDRANGIQRFLKSNAPDLAYSSECTVSAETIATVNVDCNGRVKN